MILLSVDFCRFVFLTTIKRMIRSYLGTLKTYLVEENASLVRLEHLFILSSAVTGCGPVSAFTSLVGISTGITSSLATVKICAITARIQKYMSIIMKKMVKHDKMVLLVEDK